MRVQISKNWILILVLLMACLYVWDNPPQNLVFESSVWKEEGNKLKWNKRYYMVPDLLKRNDLIGMKKATILGLLGEPDLILNNDLKYALGAVGSDSGSATLTLNCNRGVVERVEVERSP